MGGCAVISASMSAAIGSPRAAATIARRAVDTAVASADFALMRTHGPSRSPWSARMSRYSRRAIGSSPTARAASATVTCWTIVRSLRVAASATSPIDASPSDARPSSRYSSRVSGSRPSVSSGSSEKYRRSASRLTRRSPESAAMAESSRSDDAQGTTPIPP